MTTGYRTHLIFDFVDDDYNLPERILLTSDDVILQTRRSIDLRREVLQYKIEECQPRFVIIGAQKAGTTSLYEYICQHPLVHKGKRRETHYFDWRFNNAIPAEDVIAHRQYYLNFYEKELLSRHPSVITGESTPSYLFHSDLVIPRLKRYIPWAKLIIMLRNPVERAYSQYEMIQDPTGTPEQMNNRGRSHYVNKSFEEIITEEMNELKQNQIHANSTLEEFQQAIVSNKPMTHGGHSLLFRGLYCFQVENYLREYSLDQLLILSISDIKSNDKLTKTMEKVFQFIGIPYEEIADTNAKNTRAYQRKINEETKVLLEEFYKPYNERLFRALGYNISW
jgi:hypothetical protein